MKKFLFIFALVVSLVLPGAWNVYAAEYEYSDVVNQFEDKFLEFYPDKNLSDFPYYIDLVLVASIGGDTRKTFFRAYSNMPLTQIDYTDESFMISSSDQDNILSVFYDTYPLGLYVDKWNFSSGTIFLKYETDYIIGSNYDVYDDDGLLVFQKPSALLGMPREILAQVITQENPLKEILKLLPMAIPFLVGFVALRKALRTLETILKTA